MAVLFNTAPFLLGFLPIVVGGFFIVGRMAGTRVGVGCGSSPPACSSTAGGTRNSWRCSPARSSPITGWAQRSWRQARAGRDGAARRWLIAGVHRNLGAAGLVQIRRLPCSRGGGARRLHAPALDIALPLAISFFTFQQIMFLAESRRARSRRRGLHDLRRLRRLLPAPDRRADRAPARDHAATAGARPRAPARARRSPTGLTIFLLGLAKKLVLADTFAHFADVGLRRRRAGRAAQPVRGVVRGGWPTRCRSISISPAIPTWRSGWRGC